MKTQTHITYAPAVEKALKNYNTSIGKALEAVQKLEAIAITARLTKMFWVQDEKAAQLIKEDYLITS